MMEDRAHDLLLACLAGCRDTRVPDGPLVREVLDGAAPFLWTPQAIERSDREMEDQFDIRTLVLRATDLIEPKQFWMLPSLLAEEPPVPPPGKAQSRVVAMSVTDCGTGALVVIYVDSLTSWNIWTSPYPFGAAALPYGEPRADDTPGHRSVHVFSRNDLYPNDPAAQTPDDAEDERQQLSTHLLWALHCQFWLRTTVAATTSMPLSRGARRRAQRAQIEPQATRMITLRHAAPSGSEADRAAIEYTCQWMVGTHDRHLRSGKVVTVKPYIKGPKGKPLRLPARKVYKVSR